MKCTAISVPKADSVVWSFAGRELNFSSNNTPFYVQEEYTAERVVSTVTLLDPISTYFGDYNCTITNSFGTDSVIIKLTAHSKFISIITDLSFSFILSLSLFLSFSLSFFFTFLLSLSLFFSRFPSLSLSLSLSLSYSLSAFFPAAISCFLLACARRVLEKLLRFRPGWNARSVPGMRDEKYIRHVVGRQEKEKKNSQISFDDEIMRICRDAFQTRSRSGFRSESHFEILGAPTAKWKHPRVWRSIGVKPQAVHVRSVILHFFFVFLCFFFFCETHVGIWCVRSWQWHEDEPGAEPIVKYESKFFIWTRVSDGNENNENEWRSESQFLPRIPARRNFRSKKPGQFFRHNSSRSFADPIRVRPRGRRPPD